MCIRLYCHSRYMEYHVYQIWYKMCTFAEIKTLVTFICIPPLGKAPNSMINNTLTCSLPLHCHRYTILRISVSLKLISFLTESQASSPTSFWEAIWYNLAEKAKGPCFLSDFFLREAWPVRGQHSKESPRRGQQPPSSQDFCHTPQLISPPAARRRNSSNPTTLPRPACSLGASR